jgi:hypothetical protein
MPGPFWSRKPSYVHPASTQGPAQSPPLAPRRGAHLSRESVQEVDDRREHKAVRDGVHLNFQVTLIFVDSLSIMVSGAGYERRPTAEYSLARVHELAAAGCIRYLCRAVQRDVGNLSYAPQDVHKVLQTLNASHFHHAERYSTGAGWFDVYLGTVHFQVTSTKLLIS